MASSSTVVAPANATHPREALHASSSRSLKELLGPGVPRLLSEATVHPTDNGDSDAESQEETPGGVGPRLELSTCASTGIEDASSGYGCYYEAVRVPRGIVRVWSDMLRCGLLSDVDVHTRDGLTVPASGAVLVGASSVCLWWRVFLRTADGGSFHCLKLWPTEHEGITRMLGCSAETTLQTWIR